MNEKVCSNCGKHNSAEMSFCLNCGNSLAASGNMPNFPRPDSEPTVFITPPKATDANFQPLVPNRPPPAAQQKKSSVGFWLAILGGGGFILLLILGGIVGLVAMNWDKIAADIDDTPKYTPTPALYTPTPRLSPSPARTASTPVVLHSPTPNNTPAGSAPRAVFDRVWVDYNVTESGRKGMRIHAKFTTYNMKGVDSQMAVYFSYRNGEKLTTTNKAYSSTEGQVAVYRPMKPAFEPAEFADLTVFMPYDELNLGRGKYALRLDVSLIYDKGGLIQHLTTYDFDYTY